jgi:hypothetical protein
MVTSRTIAALMRAQALKQSQHLRKEHHMRLPAFAQDLLERAVKSTAQTALLFFGADKVNILAVDWETVLGLSGGAALLSVLTSLASLKLGNSGTASLTSAVEPTE